MIKSFRNYANVNGIISLNDCLLLLYPPFYLWIKEEIKALKNIFNTKTEIINDVEVKAKIDTETNSRTVITNEVSMPQ